jgi:signal peptidase
VISVRKKSKTLILNLCLGIIGLFLLSFLLVSLLAPGKIMNVFGFNYYRVLTSSMEPEIKINDVVIVVPVSEEDLQVGDIINFETYVRNIKTQEITPINVTHFLGAITEEDGQKVYKTQSYSRRQDGTFDSDWLDENGNPTDIFANQINGRVSFKIPYLGYLIQIFKSPMMIALLAVNGILIYLLVRIAKRKPQAKTGTE